MKQEEQALTYARSEENEGERHPDHDGTSDSEPYSFAMDREVLPTYSYYPHVHIRVELYHSKMKKAKNLDCLRLQRTLLHCDLWIMQAMQV